jgi:hypothetical protein
MKSRFLESNIKRIRSRLNSSSLLSCFKRNSKSKTNSSRMKRLGRKTCSKHSKLRYLKSSQSKLVVLIASKCLKRVLKTLPSMNKIWNVRLIKRKSKLKQAGAFKNLGPKLSQLIKIWLTAMLSSKSKTKAYVKSWVRLESNSRNMNNFTTVRKTENTVTVVSNQWCKTKKRVKATLLLWMQTSQPILSW